MQWRNHVVSPNNLVVAWSSVVAVRLLYLIFRDHCGQQSYRCDSPHGVSLWVFKPCSQISAEYRRFIAIRQSITEIPAHCQHDHFPGEPEARERRWWRQNRTSTGCDACAERAERRLSAVQQYHLISTRINSLACLGFAKCNNAPGTAQRPRICALTIFFL